MPLATAAAGSAVAALSEIASIEQRLAAAARSDARAARQDYIVDETLVAGSATPSFPGRAEALAELERQPAQQIFRPLGGVASRDGDLVFSWGEARWSQEQILRWGVTRSAGSPA